MLLVYPGIAYFYNTSININLSITFVITMTIKIKYLNAIDRLKQIHRSLLIINAKSLLCRKIGAFKKIKLNYKGVLSNIQR